jgi:hypothetical protein
LETKADQMRLDWIMACTLPSAAGTCRVRADAGKLRSELRSANSETRKGRQMRMDWVYKRWQVLASSSHGGHRTARGEEHRSLDETKQSRQDYSCTELLGINAHARGCQLRRQEMYSTVYLVQ